MACGFCSFTVSSFTAYSLKSRICLFLLIINDSIFIVRILHHARISNIIHGELMMKRLAKLSFIYSILGLLLGVFYREFTKLNGFTGETVLSGLHTHVLVSGVFFFLIVLLLEKSFELTKHKKFNTFFIAYNIGLWLSVIMMGVRGCVEVLNLDISSMMDASISGIAGLSHIIIAIAYILFFLILLGRINDIGSNKVD